jgi:hypothetical protein
LKEAKLTLIRKDIVKEVLIQRNKNKQSPRLVTATPSQSNKYKSTKQ